MNEDARAYIEKRVRDELEAAERKWGKGYASAHEAFGVLLEEVDEFKAEVWKKRSERDKRAMLNELVQVACVAERFAVQLVEEIGEGASDRLEDDPGDFCGYVVSGGTCGRPAPFSSAGEVRWPRCQEHANR